MSRVVVIGAGLAGPGRRLPPDGPRVRRHRRRARGRPGRSLRAAGPRRVHLRHRADRADHARPGRRRPGARSRPTSTGAPDAPPRPGLPGSVRRRQHDPRPARPGGDARGDRRAPAARRTPRRSTGSSPGSRELYEIEMPHFIDRNFDSPLDLLASPAGGGQAAPARRLRPARRRGAPALRRPAAAPAVQLPGHVRRPGPRRGARDLRRDHLHGQHRGRLVPRRRHARGAGGAWPTAAEKAGADVPLRRAVSPRSCAGPTAPAVAGVRSTTASPGAADGRRRGLHARPAGRLRATAARPARRRGRARRGGTRRRPSSGTSASAASRSRTSRTTTSTSAPSGATPSTRCSSAAS